MACKFLEWSLITESKQNITNLGYPDIVAKLFYDRFGKNAYLLARWFREYYGKGYGSDDIPPNWWRVAQLSFRRDGLNAGDLTDIYAASFDPDEYARIIEKMGLSSDDTIDDYYLADQRKWIVQELEEKIFNSTMFKAYNLVKGIANGQIKDVAPYKDLSMKDAEEKYDRKNIFADRKPIKSYPNGYKWIDVGSSCNLVGSLMKNCGSTGVMSTDPDRTMITLFDANGKAHAVVTYSPNQKRISGDQGGGSSELKPEYHEYVLDLAKHLGVQFDADKSKSPLLKLKSKLGTEVQELEGHDQYNRMFTFNKNGQQYFSNGETALSQSDLNRLQASLQQGQLTLRSPQEDILKTAFHYMNQDTVRQVVQFVPIRQFMAEPAMN